MAALKHGSLAAHLYVVPLVLWVVPLLCPAGSVPDLSHLPSLTSIALYDNQISVAPEAAFLPPSLQSLSLSRNKMKGEVQRNGRLQGSAADELR